MTNDFTLTSDLAATGSNNIAFDIQPRISIPTGARIDILLPEEFTISPIVANDCDSTTDGGSAVTSSNCYKKNQKIYMTIASQPLVLGTNCQFQIKNNKITTPTYGRYV